MLKNISVILIAFTFACASAGHNNLTRENVKNIVAGKTTQREVVQIFGYPKSYLPTEGKPMYLYNQRELQDYLYRNTLKKYSDIPAGEYEVWHYWYQFSGTGGPFMSREKRRNAIIIFNSDGIVIRKFYSERYEIVSGGGGAKLIEPKFEELE